MKFILTGCTGFIGSEVLSQCLRNPTITSVVALSRRQLPDSVSNDPKLKVVIMKDFNSYSEPVLKELAGADACIWYRFGYSKISPTLANIVLGVWEQLLETNLWKLITHLRSETLSLAFLKRSFGIFISAEQ